MKSMKYETGRLAVTKTGPNDASRLASFGSQVSFCLFLLHFFLILTKLYMLHIIYEVRDREDGGDEYDPNDARCVVQACDKFFLKSFLHIY